MSGDGLLSRLRLWEPEETVGLAWDDFLHRVADTPAYPEAAVTLSDMSGALGVFFRGPRRRPWRCDQGRRRSAEQASPRLPAAARARDETVATARYDGAELLLPEAAGRFSRRAANRKLYLWLAALAVFSAEAVAAVAPIRCRQMSRASRAGRRRHARQARGSTRSCAVARPALRRALAARPALKLPPIEAAVERWIRAELAGETHTASDDALTRALAGDAGALAALVAPKDYKPFRPVPVWLHRRAAPAARSAAQSQTTTPGPGSGASADTQRKKRAAERQKSDQAERRDSLILHRFESILAMADFLNLNRAVDDDDEAGARKAADDAEKMAVGEHRKSPKTRLKFDLDLAPEDADRETTAGRHVYPEWNYKTRSLDPARIPRVSKTWPTPADAILQRGPDARRRITAKVRRRFEALRPRRRMLSRQSEGSELDLDEVRARARRPEGGPVGRSATGSMAARATMPSAIWLSPSCSTSRARPKRRARQDRDLDRAGGAGGAGARGSTPAAIRLALYAFSSVRRDRVFVDVCKNFDEPFNHAVDARIAGLKPGFYTRLGAAIRHVSFRLSERPSARKLLLVITDGKPNDIDHYEGRFGIEDTRMAVAGGAPGHAVFAVTVDEQARAYLPYLFGRAGLCHGPGFRSADRRIAGDLPAHCRVRRRSRSRDEYDEPRAPLEWPGAVQLWLPAIFPLRSGAGRDGRRRLDVLARRRRRPAHDISARRLARA